MSKNLGQIHYMMYEKIKFQDQITAYLLDGKNDLLDLDPVSTDPLDKIIDQDNIHGFLQEKIDIVEQRLAKAMSLVEDVDEKLYEFGRKIGRDKDFSSFENIFTDLNMYLLDGMPCDNGLSAVVSGDSLLLITNNNLHSKYEEKIDLEKSRLASCDGDHDHDHHDTFDLKNYGKIELQNENSPYHKHRLAFLKGYFDNSPYDVDLVEGINYRIYKKL